MFPTEAVINYTQQMNTLLSDNVPGYRTLNESAKSVYGYSKGQVEGVIVFVDQKWEKTGGAYYKQGKKMITDMREIVEKKTDDVLTKVETTINVEKTEEDAVVVKSPKTRIIAIVLRLNQIVIMETDRVK